MDHIEIIKKIIEAEEQAQSIAKRAFENEENLEKNVSDSLEKLKKTFNDKIDKRIQAVSESEAQLLKESLFLLEAKHKKDMDKLKKIYTEHKEEWLNSVLENIILK